VIAKKMLTFSLVSIPVDVMAATERHRVDLHLVHGGQCGARVRQPRLCEVHGSVPASEIEHGYALPSGDMLVLSDQDLADLPMPDTREIRILGFIPADRVDPIHYDRSYYLGARDRLAARPYSLLREALEHSGQVAIGRTALRTRDSLVAIGVRGDVLTMTTLLWPDEVRAPGDIAPGRLELRPEEVALAEQLMTAVSEGWRIEDEEDEYTRALQEVVEAKAAGLEPPHAPEARVLPAGGVSDLIAVLEAAVAKAEEEHPKAAGKRPARKAAAKRSASGRQPRN
jgi:DNA end-binding protein Ku